MCGQELFVIDAQARMFCRIGLQVEFFGRCTTGSQSGGGGSIFPRVKRRGREVDHSPPIGAEIKKMWIYTSILPYAFMAFLTFILYNNNNNNNNNNNKPSMNFVIESAVCRWYLQSRVARQFQIPRMCGR
jgi:hypothetical protein